MRKILVLTVAFAVLGTMVALFYIHSYYPIPVVTIPKFNHAPAQSKKTIPSASSTSTAVTVPNSLLLPVPMTAQAPTGNWDQLHNEACEEANAIMANAYFNLRQNLDPNYVESQINLLTQWEDQNFGYHLDTTTAETAKMIEAVYGLKTKLIYNFTADDLKNALIHNQLAIISENGRLLNNPYYKSPGPIHHMLLVKGYNSAGFITNDSGTKRGLNYFYDFDTLKTAAADWDHSQNTTDVSQKVAIIVWK